MRLFRKTSRKARSLREFARGLARTDHPLLVHIVPIRRCNIDCGYCNEYDKVSAPVPARTNDMNLTGAVAAPAKAAQPVKVASAVASSGASDAGLVDLNRGSLEDLNTLDGAGSLGKAIIRGRPYASVDDLVKKRVLRRTSFEKIKDQVTVQ